MSRLSDELSKAKRLYNKAIKEGYGDLSIHKRYLGTLEKLTGSQDFKVGSAVRNSNKVAALKYHTEKYLNSDWQTEEGRKGIFKKARTTFKIRNEGFTNKQYAKFIDLLQNDAVAEIIELDYLSSSQLVSYISEVAEMNKENYRRIQMGVGTSYIDLQGILEELREELQDDPDLDVSVWISKKLYSR